MPFQIQDPTDSHSITLHESLISACNGANSGGGAFAFVTAGGINLYLEDCTSLNKTELFQSKNKRVLVLI